MTNAVSIAQSGSNNVTMRNRIINGAQIVDQRASASSAVTVNSVTKTYATDRFCGTGIGSAGVFTLGQVTTAPSNFINSLKATVTTADASLAATDLYRLMHLIEGLNVADLGWGTAAAQTVTLSFWVYSNLTGTFGGSLTNSAANYSYPFSFTISAASTWEQKTITIAGPTSGTWLTTNGIGVAINWGLGVGSTYSGTSGSWSANEYYSTTGATNVMGTLSNTFYITGVQLEKGSTATPFEQRLYGTELRLCQRYLPYFGGIVGQNQSFGQCYSNTTTELRCVINFPVQARVTPTGLVSSTASGFIGQMINSINLTASAVSFSSIASTTSQLIAFTVSGATANQSGAIYNASAGYIYFTGCEL